MRQDIPSLCPRFHLASELIGRRWTGAIIYVLLKRRAAPSGRGEGEGCRFATLRAAIPGITDRMLSERLSELEEQEVVVRTVVPQTPVRVEYSLTKKGRELGAAVDAIAAWAERWVAAPGAPEPARRPVRSRRSASGSTPAR